MMLLDEGRDVCRVGFRELDGQTILRLVHQFAFPTIGAADGTVDLRAGCKTFHHQTVSDLLGILLASKSRPADHELFHNSKLRRSKEAIEQSP